MTITGENCVKAKRAKLLGTLKLRHGFLPSIENQPPEATLVLLVKMHANRSAGFFSLTRVSNFSDGRDIRVKPQRVRGAPLLMESNGINTTRTNNDFLASADAFGHAVRVLMHGSALVSMSSSTCRGESMLSMSLSFGDPFRSTSTTHSETSRRGVFPAFNAYLTTPVCD